MVSLANFTKQLKKKQHKIFTNIHRVLTSQFSLFICIYYNAKPRKHTKEKYKLT